MAERGPQTAAEAAREFDDDSLTTECPACGYPLHPDRQGECDDCGMTAREWEIEMREARERRW